MPSTINSTTTGSGGLITTGDASNELQIQTGDTTRVTIDGSGNVSINGNTTLGDASGDSVTINASTVSTPNGLNFDSNTLVIDATNNRVGIGTSSPGCKLDVYNSAAAAANNEVLRLRYTTSTTAGHSGDLNFTNSSGTALGRVSSVIQDGSNIGLAFSTYSSSLGERMRIDGSGNVGIGTSSPSSKLTVSGSGATLGQFISSGSSTYLEMDNSGGGGYIGTNGNNLLFLTSTAGTERMRIDSSGNVGIGTTSPAAKLEVLSSGTSTSAGENISGRFSSNGGGYAATIQFSDNIANTAWISMLSSSLVFGPASTERMRIDSSGNLLVGTTTVVSPNPGISFAPGSVSQISIGHGNGQSSGTYYVYFAYNGTIIGSITQNGTTAVAYNTSSDYRLKHDIQPMTGALAKVAQLKPVTYKWNADNSQSQGFIAHELQEVVPDCVTGEKDAVDDDGNPVYQGIDTSFLVATLTAAIQELKAENDALKARLDAAGL